MATRWNLWQETQRPKLLLKMLSKETINPFHLSRLRTDNFVQIQSIKTSSNQHLYEEKMPVLKSKIFSITIISIGKVFMLKSNPNPKKSNRQPIPKNYLKKCHLIGYSKWQRIQGWNIQKTCYILKPIQQPIKSTTTSSTNNSHWKTT